MKMTKPIVGTLILSILLAYMAQANSTHHNEEEIPTVTYCDLLRNPQKYDKKTVRLRIIYMRGFEGSTFYDPECDSQKETWVVFDPASRQCTKAAIQKEYDKVFYPPPKKQQKGVIELHGTEKAALVAVGQFNGPKPGIPIGTEGKRILTGYGHLNGYDYQFIIKCIEEVRPAPNK